MGDGATAPLLGVDTHGDWPWAMKGLDSEVEDTGVGKATPRPWN